MRRSLQLWKAWRPAMVVGLITHAGIAWAQPSEADKDRAANDMRQGDALFEAKDFGQALVRYQSADSIMNVPSTGVAVARALRELARLKEAKAIAARVANSRPAPVEPAAFVRARVEAAQMISDLERETPVIQIVVRATGCASAPSIWIDNEPASASLGVSVDPGRHDVRVQASGCRTYQHQVTLDRRERSSIRVLVTPQSAGLETTAVAAPAPVAIAPRTSSWTYVGFGIGAVGISVGAFTGILTLSQASEVKQQCQGTECPWTAQEDADRAKRMGWISTISFGVGIAGVGVGLVSLLSNGSSGGLGSSRAARRALVPVVGVGSVAIQGTF